MARVSDLIGSIDIVAAGSDCSATLSSMSTELALSPGEFGSREVRPGSGASSMCRGHRVTHVSRSSGVRLGVSGSRVSGSRVSGSACWWSRAGAQLQHCCWLFLRPAPEPDMRLPPHPALPEPLSYVTAIADRSFQGVAIFAPR